MPTVGVSLPVPAPWGPQLQDYRIALGDSEAAGIPTHITLIPPTEITEAAVPDVVAHLTAVTSTAAPVEVLLRGTGTFRPVSPVVFITVALGISACEQLAARLRTGPLATDLSFPYHPHVTVAHRLDDAALDRAFAELADFEAGFVADHVQLYSHDPVTGWHPTHAFHLGGAPHGD